MTENNKKERGFKGIWIPKEIWLAENLSLQEKVMLAEIDSLDNEDGCTASNEYFSKFFDLSETRISNIISSLKEKDLIEQTEFTGRKRTLRVKENFKAALKNSLNIYNSIDNISINRNINGSEEPLDNPKKMVRSKKPKQEPKPKYSEEFINLVGRWNRIEGASTHNLEKNTKTLAEANKLFKKLKSGTFLSHATAVAEWLREKYPDKYNEYIRKKWTYDEIRLGIKRLELQFQDGYWPETPEKKKDLLPKTLEFSLYNFYNKECPSAFIKVMIKAPEKIYENADIKYPQETELLLAELVNANEKITPYQKAEIIRQTNKIGKWYNRIYDDAAELADSYKEFGKFSSWVGDKPDSPRKLIDLLYIPFLKQKGKFTPNNIKYNNWLWRDFIEWVKKFHGIDLEPGVGKQEHRAEVYEIEEYL